MPISEESATITGISDADVAGVAPRWADLAAEVTSTAAAGPCFPVYLLVPSASKQQHDGKNGTRHKHQRGHARAAQAQN
jgi:aminoglycoside phosphotransferase